MSVFPTKPVLVALTLTLWAGTALAQATAPLALPPSATQDPPPVIISAPTAESTGLAATPPPEPIKPIITPPPVEAAMLKDIAPDSIGTLTTKDGSLGATLWKGTSRILVEHFMPMLSLPLSYATLNDLAARFLLTTAGAPDGPSGSKQSLTAMRVDKLVALGKADEAWKLASMAGADQIDDISLRMTAEAALVSSSATDVCAKLPAILAKHTTIEWQKLLVACQFKANDPKAAQVSLDLLRTPDLHDDTFLSIADKNVIAGSKQLPRQLTPLSAINLTMIRMTDAPVRTEVYAHPDAALIPELLNAKSVDENARLALAERAAAKGIISATTLADIYRKQPFTPETLSNADVSGEQGPLLRALMFQAAQQEKNPLNRVNQAVKFMQSLDATSTGSEVLSLPGVMIGSIEPTAILTSNAANIARIYILSGDNNAAIAWLDFARNAARTNPQLNDDLKNLWPLIALGGFESEKNFADDLSGWLNMVLPAADQDTETRGQKAAVCSLLLLLDAVGMPVTDEAWAKTVDAAVYEKLPNPPAVVLSKLRSAAAENRKGETILMILLAANSGKDDPSILATVNTIRALRQIGMIPEAGNLAKEAALHILTTVQKP